MAIRSGTGGLKYPLPANTDVQASIAAASSGGSAAASAYGANRQFAANRMRVQADLANSAAERQFRALSQMGEQQFRAQQEFYDREHAKGAQLEAQRFDAERQQAMFGQQTALQQSSQKFQESQNLQDQTYQSDRDLRQIQAKQVAGLPEIPENARGQTRQHLQRLQGALQELVGQGWNPNDPATRETFYQTYRDYLSIVQSIPKEDPTEEFQRKTFEVNGTRLQKTQSGQYVEVPNSVQQEQRKEQQAAAAAQEKLRIEDTKRAEGLMDDDADLTAEEAMQKAIKIREGLERVRTPHPPMLPPGAVETLPALPPNTPVPPGVVGTQPALPPNTPVPPGVVVQTHPAAPQDMGESVRQRSGSDMLPAPPEFPQGSLLVDDDTVMMPGGRMFKRNRK